MTTNIIRLPANDIVSFTNRALQLAGRCASFIANRFANSCASDLARTDRRSLADTGYGRIDWNSENGEAIQSALIKIYDW
jgi:hypothetical protein